jgi:PIN domain nuclease of toxin-antitoxin system
MKLLLDTHIWLWGLIEPGRLATRVASALRGSDTERWLSPLSVREHVDRPADAWVREALERAPVREAPVNHEVALASRRLKTKHRDPVDRFLIATGQVFDVTLVTQDAMLMSQADVKVLPNRVRRAHSGR